MNQQLQVEYRRTSELKPFERNARTHSKKQIRQIADSIQRFGFTNPILIGDDDGVIAGHGRLAAAKLLSIDTVPTLRLSNVSETERRGYVLADNKLALNAGWDREILALELQGLIDLEFDMSVTGFSLAEIDIVLDEAADGDPDGADLPEDAVPAIAGQPVTRRGDVWHLGRHKLICGDARCAEDYAALLGNELHTWSSQIPPTMLRSTAMCLASAKFSTVSLPLPVAR